MYFQPQDVATITQLNGHRILLHSSMFPGNLNLPSVYSVSHMTLLQKYSLWMRYSLHSNLIFDDQALIHLNNVSKMKYIYNRQHATEHGFSNAINSQHVITTSEQGLNPVTRNKTYRKKKNFVQKVIMILQ